MTTIGKIAVAAMAFALALAASVAAEAQTAPNGENHLRYVLNMDVDYPALGDRKIDAMLRQWLTDILNGTLRGMAGVSLGPDVVESVNEIQAGCGIVRPSKRIAGAVFRTYAYPSGAAHGTTRVDSAHFDMLTRERLGLEDFFENPDQAVAIMAERAGEAIVDSLKEERPDVDASSLFADGFAPARENFRTFVIEPDGVRVIFQEYQVLPYVFGRPEAWYSLETLAPAGPRLEYWGIEI